MRDADWTPARANPVGIRVEAVYLGIHTVAPNRVLHRPLNANRPSPRSGTGGKALIAGEAPARRGKRLLDHEVDEEDFGDLLFLGQDGVDAPLEFLTSTLPADFVIEFINTLGTHGGGDHILDLEDVRKH